MRLELSDEQERTFLSELAKIPGGYTYSGACSYQVCFYLRDGGELRFSVVDEDCTDEPGLQIDLYDGALPPCITGFGEKTGEINER